MHLVQYLHAFDTSDGTSTWSRTTTTDAASPDQSTYSAQRYTVTCLSYISISRAQGRLGLRVLGARRRLAYAEPAIEEVSRVTCIVACFGFFFHPGPHALRLSPVQRLGPQISPVSKKKVLAVNVWHRINTPGMRA